MHFAIGTANRPKSAAIERVLSTAPYTAGNATFSNHRVESGVPDMPTTLSELRNGAKNRAVSTRRICPTSDYFVGMEGGVYQDSEGEEYWLIGVVYIEDRDGRGYFGYSAHLPLPIAVVDGLFDVQGREIEHIIHSLGGEANVGDQGGSIGALTDGMIPRSELFVSATQCALAPFFNQYYQK